MWLSKTKYIVVVLSLLCIICSVTSFNLVAHADPFDPLSGFTNETESESTVDGAEWVEENKPELETDSTDESAVESESETKTAKDWEEENRLSTVVDFMNGTMVVAGMLGFLIPMIYFGIFLCAKVSPRLFTGAFVVVSFNHPDVLESSIPSVFFKMFPISCLGMFMLTGQMKPIFRAIWAWVEIHILYR